MFRITAIVFLCFWWCNSHAASARSTQSHAPPPRPLIVVPGIAGSELWIEGKLAWGSLDGLRHLENLRITDGPRKISAAETCDPANSNEAYRSTCGTLNQFIALGPLKIDVYEPLWRYLESLGYTRFGERKNLFIFPYDWRRSNFDTAADLDAFIRSKPELAGKEIDILAHSMGGLVSLIYTNKYDAPAGRCDFPRSCRVKTVITMGTPFWGSVTAVATPFLGWGRASRWLIGGTDTIIRTLLSWPSLYELLPTYENCCVSTDGPKARSLNLLELADFSVLPFDLARNGIPLDRVSDALKTAAELRKLVDAGFPKHVRAATTCPGLPPDGLFTIAGDRNGTRQSLTIGSGKMLYIERRGDGTVSLRSATAGNPAGGFLSFMPHMSIFNDENAQAKLETILFRCEMGFSDFTGNIPTVEVGRQLGPSTRLPIDFVSVDLVDDDTTADAFAATGTLSLTAPDDAIAPVALLTVKLNGTEISRTQARSTTRRSDGSVTQFGYVIRPIKIEGEGRVDVELTFGIPGRPRQITSP
jgi:pimeloyl-ACP methyl ester carboxylesterase